VQLKDTESGGGQLSMDYSKYHIVKAGDFVMNHMDLLTGFIDISQFNGVTSPDYRVFVPRCGVDIHRRYYLYIFQLCYHSRLFYPLGHGSSLFGRWRLPRSAFEAFALPVPRRHEQQAIADFLDRKTAAIDQLIAKKERLIELLQEKRRALITQAVTKGLDPGVPMKDSGIEWLGRIPDHWVVSELRHHLSKIEQGWSPQCESRPAEVDEWGVMKAGCVNRWRFREEENKALPPGLEPRVEYEIRPRDLLMSRANTRELLGSAALVRTVRKRLLLCDKLYRLRYLDDRVSGEYLELLLSSSVARFQMEREATGTSGSMQNIGQDTVKRLAFPWPSFEEQVALADQVQERVSRIVRLEGEVGRSIATLHEYRQALITEAVTGKLDVTRSTDSAASFAVDIQDSVAETA
jgi:type I restriction enzyme S subunit